MTGKQVTTDGSDRILTGQANWLRWYPQFEHDAYADDLDTLFDGTEDIRNKPVRDAYINVNFTSAGDDDAASHGSSSNTSALPNGPEVQRCDFTYKTQLDRYRDDLKEFEKQQERVRRANKLLFERVDQSIQPEIRLLRKPNLALDHLRNQYKMQDSCAKRFTNEKLDQLTLASCSDMTDYLGKMRQLKHDLESLRAPLSDDIFIDKIIKGLPSAYDSWIERYHDNEADPSATDYTLKSVEAQLTVQHLLLR